MPGNHMGVKCAPGPYEVPNIHRLPIDREPEGLFFTGWDHTTSKPTTSDMFRTKSEALSPEREAEAAAARAAAQIEREMVHEMLGLGEPLDTGLTFAEEVARQQREIDEAVSALTTREAGGQNHVPQEVGSLALAGAR